MLAAVRGAVGVDADLFVAAVAARVSSEKQRQNELVLVAALGDALEALVGAVLVTSVADEAGLAAALVVRVAVLAARLRTCGRVSADDGGLGARGHEGSWGLVVRSSNGAATAKEAC